MRWLILFVICIICVLALLKPRQEQVPAAVPPGTPVVDSATKTVDEPAAAVSTNELVAEPVPASEEPTNSAAQADIPVPSVAQTDVPMNTLVGIIRLQSAMKVPHDMGDLKSLDGRIYKGVTVTRIEPDGISFRHSGGSAKLGIGLLPADLEVKYHIKKGTAELYSQEMNRRKQVVLLARAEQQASNQQTIEQERLQRQTQNDEAQRARMAKMEDEQDMAARAAWSKYERDMQDYRRKVSEVEWRKTMNRNLIVKMPVEPIPPSVQKPRYQRP